MSRRGLARHNAKRDENEPELRKRFALHGWHTEQVSGKGMPDLMVWPNTVRESNYQCLTASALVDVKMPDGTLTEAQKEKWPTLHEKGIPVYVVRTVEDVDALVRGELAPWAPQPVERRGRKDALRAAGAALPKPPRKARNKVTGWAIGMVAAAYTPPEAARMHARSTRAAAESIVQSEDPRVLRAVSAAHEAGGTFAPPVCTTLSPCGHCMDCIGTLP